MIEDRLPKVLDETTRHFGGIYAIFSEIDDRFYIGSTNNFGSRHLTHLSELHHKRHHSQKLQNFANKYGVDKLRFEIVEVVGGDHKERINKEQFYLDLLKPAFNICTSAAGSSGSIKSVEGRRRISLSKIGNKYCLGRKVTQETKDKLSKLHKGRVMSEEQKQKLRATKRKKRELGYKQSPEQIIKRLVTLLGTERIKKVKEIQQYFDSNPYKFGASTEYLSTKYGFTRKLINNIRTGKQYANLRTYEL